MRKMNSVMLVFSLIIIGVIFINVFTFSTIKFRMNGSQARYIVPEWTGYLIALNMVLLAIYHLPALLSLVHQFRKLKSDNVFRSAAFVLGVFSVFLLLVDGVMLNDIGHEYLLKHEISGEWNFLWSNHVIHGLFTLMVLILCVINNTRPEQVGESIIVKDESLFLTVHQVGISTAVLGFIWMAILFGFDVPKTYINRLLFLSTIASLIPYGISVAYWLITKRKERLMEWYDEKQFADISRGALVTLVVSVFTMMGIFFLIANQIIKAEIVIWFPIYLFATLLLFSGSSLYFSKRV